VPTNPESDPFKAAAQLGFLDPSNNTPILPIMVDVAALRAALVTTAPSTGDLGEARCLGNDTVLCPIDKKFKGSAWIGTLPGGALPDGNPGTPCPLVNHPAPTTAILSGLACVRPNALVLFNLDDISAFNVTGEFGLSIGSNLPIYVVGDINKAAPGRNDARVALLAPQITALSRGFKFSKAAWGGVASIVAALGADKDLTWNTSLFTGWIPSSTAQRDPARHIIRQLEGNMSVDLTGSIVVMFTHENYLQKTDFNRSKGSYSSNPDPGVSGLPVFNPSADPAEATRFVSGTVRFPGKSPRDLRDTRVEMQPPNAPRLSIELQPLDKR
jgi:hypothetical protein